jgi:hypothetical protein
MSPSKVVHHGPAAWWLMSMMRMPVSAPFMRGNSPQRLQEHKARSPRASRFLCEASVVARLVACALPARVGAANLTRAR